MAFPQPCKILIVASAFEADRLGSALRTEALTVVAVGSEREAFAVCRPIQPDLAVVEVHALGFDGVELVERLVVNGVRIPTIFISQRGPVEERLRALEVGDDFLVRPFDPAELTARASAILRRYRRSDTPLHPRPRSDGPAAELSR